MPQSFERQIEVFNAALELPAAHRAAYLDEACGGDAELRQRVEALLQAEDRVGQFLLSPAVDWAELGGNIRSPVIPEAKPANRIGRYKLLQALGEGGCGVVYMAQQEEPVRRRVALKVIKLGMDTKQVIARFEAERQALALMDHPNIAKVLDAGATETGRPYFVMELVRGIKITDFCDEHSLSTEDRLKLFIQVCQAIQHAHQKGIIHRDIKPSNILITINDGVPVPKVIDFGIAKATQGRLTDQTLFTAFEQFIGTPAYMSPEQAVMTSLDIDTRSDIYSLGVLLYELLTGGTPFDQKELLAAGLDEMRRTIRETEPPRPSTRLSALGAEALTTTAKHCHTDAPKLLHAVRGDLDWIVMKCLEKDRGRRYETANGLASDIQRHLNCEPVIARPPSRLYEFQKTVRRHKFGFAAAATIMAVLVAGVLVSTWQAVRIAASHRVATEKLFESYLVQARALRQGGSEGQRFESLETVGKAAAIQSSPQLRNEAIACLAMTDVRLSQGREAHDVAETWDKDLNLRAFRQGDGSVSVMRVRDNSEVARLTAVGAVVNRIHAFSPSGQYLAASYFGGRNIVWDIQKRQPAIEVPGGISADFTADGQTVVFICEDGQLRRFGLDPVRPLPSLMLNHPYHSLRLRPQSDWFAVYGWESPELQVWDLRDGSLLKKFSHPSNITSFAWSTDGTHLVVGCDNGWIFMWNALTGEREFELQSHEDSVVSVGLSRSGWLLGSSSWDGQFRLWDLAIGRNLLTTDGWSYQVSFAENDHRLAYVYRGTRAGALEITPSSIFHRLNCKRGSIRGSWTTDISPDGRLVATASVDGVRIWADEESGAPFFLAAPGCWSVIFTPDGANLVTCSSSGLARWPLQRISGATADEIRMGPRQTIRDGLDFNYAALSADGRWVAAANPRYGALSIYEVNQPTNRFPLVSQPATSFPAFSPGGRWLAAGNWKGSGVKVWDFEGKREACTLPTPSSAKVGFSPDKRWVLTAGASYDLWETGTWKHKYQLTRRASSDWAASCLAFSPDGFSMAVAREPRVIQLVTVETGEVLANLEAPNGGALSCLRFSPDGTRLYALEWGQQVQVWDLRGIREELRKLNLDWNAPPIPPQPPGPTAVDKPLRISLAESGSP